MTFTCLIFNVNGFNFCGVLIDEPNLNIKDSTGNNLLWIDRDGDMAIKAQLNPKVTSYSTSYGKGFIIKDNSNSNELFFTKTNSNYVSVSTNQNNIYVSSKGIEIKNPEKVLVAFLSSNKNIYIKGNLAKDNTQSNCPIDSWDTCSGKIKEFRDYSCNSNTQNCDSVISDTYNCANQDYNYCSGKNIMKKTYGCSSGICGDSFSADTLISTCDTYSYCDSSVCKSYQWRVKSISGCSARCGQGIRTKNIVCINQQGLETSTNNCNPSTKPAPTLSCQDRVCATCAGVTYDDTDSNLACYRNVLYSRGQWIPLESVFYRQSDPDGYFSNTIIKTITSPARICRVRAYANFNDGGFVTLFNGNAMHGLWWRNIFVTTTIMRNQDNILGGSPCRFAYTTNHKYYSISNYYPQTPYMSGSKLMWCAYPRYNKAGDAHNNGAIYNSDIYKGQILKIHSVHSIGGGQDEHRYSLQGLFC